MLESIIFLGLLYFLVIMFVIFMFKIFNKVLGIYIKIKKFLFL